jgi:glucose-6-phosphate dehydrogenase assembly protein OpcA
VSITEAIEATLADLRALEAGSADSGVRTNILDLVIMCDDRETADELVELVANLPYSRPSRAIVALADEHRGEVEYDARVFCSVSNSGEGTQVCSELVTLSAGEGGAALPSLIASLTLPDLPVFLLWRAEPEFAGLMIDRVWPLVTRVVVDSTLQEGTLEQLPFLLGRMPRRDVTDLSWTKITGWREAVARPFDTPENARCLGTLARVEVHHAGASDAQARLLAGWVLSRVGSTTAEVVIESERRRDMRSGSLTSVKLTCGEQEYLVERVKEGVGRVVAPNIPEHTVPLPVPKLRELVALELQVFDPDEIFEAAVLAAPGIADAEHAPV